MAHKLEAILRFWLRQTGLHLAVNEDLQRARIQAFQEILLPGVGSLVSKQIIVKSDLCVQGGGGVHPVEGSPLDLSPVRRVTSLTFRVIGGQDLGHVPPSVLNAPGTGDKVGSLQPAFRTTGVKPLILGNWLLKKVLSFHPQVPGEGDRPGSGALVSGNIFDLKGLRPPLGIVSNGELDRPEDCHDPPRCSVQILPKAVFQEAKLHSGGCLGNTVALREIPDGGRSVAPAAQAAEGRHTGIVPAGDPSLLHQLAELALAHDGVVDTQSGKLDLSGFSGNVAVLNDPVIKGSVVLKLQGA